MLTTLDLTILLTYLGLLWGVGLWIAFRHRKHDADFMLNRHYSWFNIGSSIFATNIGPVFLIGNASAAFAAGMATANFEWLAWIFLLLLGMVCAPYYIRMRITTMPEFIRRRFGRQAADFLSLYGLFTVIILWIGGDLFVGGKLLHQMLNYPETTCVVALAVVFTTFTVAGGFSAVMVTDTAQAIMMIVSMVVLNVIAYNRLGGLDELVKNVPGEFWQVLRPANDAKFPWVAIILGYPVIGFWFWCTDQTIVQRMLGARDLKQAQYGTIYTGFLKILPPFLFLMPGIFCLALKPDLDDPDKAFLTMLTHFMPVGMMGLMIAVLFAAAVAGVAGGLNAFSTIFTMDIYKGKLRPSASDHQLKRVSQISIVVVSIAAVGVALLLQGSKKNIFETLQGMICYFAPPMTSIFLLSLLWKRVTTKGVLATLYIGTAVCLTVGVLSLRELLPVSPWTHFMMLTFLLFLFCMAILVGVSLLTQHSDCEEPLATASAGVAVDAAGQGAGRSGWVLWGMLAVVMVGLYAGFQTMSAKRQNVEIYLSPDGRDDGSGRAVSPFRTVDRARGEVRKMQADGRLPEGGVNVWLHKGIYPSEAPPLSAPEDSGVPGKPIRWRSFPGEKPVFQP
ncbi:MAG: sodium/solute symporter [Luteolibacter sp.]